MKNKKVTPSDLELFNKLKEEGLSYMQIAFRTGFSYYTVLYNLSSEYKECVKRNQRILYHKKRGKK